MTDYISGSMLKRMTAHKANQPEAADREYLLAIADRIISEYKEHYDFPSQGESHMHDCIIDVLAACRQRFGGEGEPVVESQEFSHTELVKVVSDFAAVAEHDAEAYRRTGGNQTIGINKNVYARTCRAAANLIESCRPAADNFQQRVAHWMHQCFGPVISADTQERNHRFLEEALELVQACGATAHEAHQLVDYVYDRPVGEKHQEVGGVMVTLAALCLAQGLDMHANGETELGRILRPEMVEKIRAKQAAKPKHSPLPEIAKTAPAAEPSATLLCKACGADRAREDCKGDRMNCGISGTAQAATVAQPSAAKGDDKAAIPATMFHDAGAYAQCHYCKRYSKDPRALSKDSWPCDCGKLHGWSGSFKTPDETAVWSVATSVKG